MQKFDKAEVGPDEKNWWWFFLKGWRLSWRGWSELGCTADVGSIP